MISFLEFINKDISAKKTMITSMPVKTKTNIKKYNKTLDEFKEKYSDYKGSVYNYLLAKSRSFNLKNEKDNADKVTEKLVNLERVKFLLNPTNTFFEKMSFDVLLYQLNNSYMFNFKSLNDVINGFLDKFDLVGVKLSSNDFNYTCYVHEYMTSFLEVRNSETKKYAKVSAILEQIYWMNPELIDHIELNFRRLIKKHEKKFNAYISKIQKQSMAENKIKNYQDCLDRLKTTYIELNLTNKEDVFDIVELGRNNEYDINQYLPDSKVRTNAYESLITGIEYSDKDSMGKLCEALEKLKNNIIEYDTYNEFLPLFNYFKEEYQSLLEVNNKEYKGLKDINAQIVLKEKELDKLNKKIFGGKVIFNFGNTDKDLKKLKADSVRIAKELYDLYKQHDQEYFKSHIMKFLSSSMTISDILNIYYSFDYFKKLAIQKAYDLQDYDEIIRLSDNFYLFATNPMNVIIAGIPVFEEANIAKVIANKYRLNSLKITEDDLKPENLKPLLNKIQLILRVEKIEASDKTSLEKIWFIVQVEKIIAKNAK